MRDGAERIERSSGRADRKAPTQKNRQNVLKCQDQTRNQQRKSKHHHENGQSQKVRRFDRHVSKNGFDDYQSRSLRKSKSPSEWLQEIERP
jgi:hypothetical protein